MSLVSLPPPPSTGPCPKILKRQSQTSRGPTGPPGQVRDLKEHHQDIQKHLQDHQKDLQKHLQVPNKVLFYGSTPPSEKVDYYKCLVSALLKSYRHHLLSHSRDAPGEDFGKFWAGLGVV